jgi:hypothetical protein
VDALTTASGPKLRLERSKRGETLMKRQVVVILGMLLMLGTSMSGAATQLPTRCVVLVHVPFTFQVAGHALPPGYYQFEQILGNTDGLEVLVVRSSDRKFYQAVVTRAEKMDETRQPSKIVFRRSGENLVLVELCSQSKHAVLKLYDAGTKQPILMAEKYDDVVLPVPSDGELLAMARPVR